MDTILLESYLASALIAAGWLPVLNDRGESTELWRTDRHTGIYTLSEAITVLVRDL